MTTPVDRPSTTGALRPLPKLDAPKPAEHPNAWMLAPAQPRDGGDDSAQTASSTTPTLPATLPDFSEPSAFATVGIPTSNDGRADVLNTTPFTGKRAEAVANLNTQIDQIHAQQQDTQEQIAKYEASVKTKDGRAEAFNDAVQVLNPVIWAADGVANLFGKQFDPAKDGANAVQGTKDDYNQLVSKRDQLKSEEADLTKQRDTLTNERALNYLTNVAHLTNMTGATTGLLDGDSNVKVEVADYDDDGSEARYDATTNTIKVPHATIDKVNESLTALQRQGVVDDDGKIIDPKSFDVSKAGDDAIAFATLIGVHEATHAEQNADGRWQQAVNDGADVEAGDPATEYDAYLNMESQQLQSGRRKGGLLTIDSTGKPLPREQADANILAYEAGEPLPYGSGGVVGTAAAAGGGPTAGGADSAPGRHGPGRHGPGRHGPGRHGPGRHGPGRHGPGRHGPGRHGPGRSGD